MAEQCGFSTGVDPQALVRAVALAGELVGYPVGGRSARWLSAAQVREQAT